MYYIIGNAGENGQYRYISTRPSVIYITYIWSLQTGTPVGE
jgi:hypothetical protein